MCGDVIWSPVGETIAYQSVQGGDWEVYVMQSDGSGVTQLTDEPGDVVSRLWGWSPNGRQITFLRVEQDSNGDGDVDLSDDADVWVMGADGSGQANVSDHVAPDVEPSWQP
jgi:TolB protein